MKWEYCSKAIQVPLVAVAMATLVIGSASALADFTFGKPLNLGPVVNGRFSLDVPDCISADGLELYFTSDRPNGVWHLWVTKRASDTADWGPPENLGPNMNEAGMQDACLSADGLSLYFASYHDGGVGGADIWVTTRASRNDPWGKPVNLGPPINTVAGEYFPWISADGLEFYFDKMQSYATDIWRATRATKEEPWGKPVMLGPVVTALSDTECPYVSADGLLLFFNEDGLGPFRPGGYGGADIWVSRRATPQDDWGTPANLGPRINSPRNDGSARVSADGRMLYFYSERPCGGADCWDIWQSPIVPILDFNGDGKVDTQDLLRMIGSWGKNDPRCDIGPMPWGDGKVDEKDLEVLMRCWGQEVNDPTLVANWKLDETQGTVAHDNTGDHDGTVHGGPIWQPQGGMVGGALLLDGVDDYISTGFVLDPTAGPFSVFAWVKGGVPGQVILSQDKGANWLLAIAPTGALTTELTSGRGGLLASPAIITDGVWHRVGFVRDGSDRILYVDDVEVARDAVPALQGSTGGLYIGGGSKLAAGTFWSGLIDDVRVYDRAVKP